MFPKSLQTKIQKRKNENSLRRLGEENGLVDFSSNDYLGFSKSKSIFDAAHTILEKNGCFKNGSTGSRLLTGNHQLYKLTEDYLAEFHNSEEALIYNSGYDANVGLFSCVPQLGDVVLYDEFIHMSIRDGITICRADAIKFKHNDLRDLENKLKGLSVETKTIYIVSESVFSMDGDSPDLRELVSMTKKYDANLIIDEAHAVGVFGENGSGLIQQLGLENAIFARIVTFGKAMGCHGAAILCSKDLKEYLINYSRSLIYTTALPPHSVATIYAANKELIFSNERTTLSENIKLFKSELNKNRLHSKFIKSDSAIQSCIIRGNDEVKIVASKLKKQGFNVKPILYPSVALGQERLRFCIHSFNSTKEITLVLNLLSDYVGQKMQAIDE